MSQTAHNQVAGAGSMSARNDVIVEARVKRADIDFDAFNDAKRRKTEKGGKGLRHFSMKVCEKVQAKGSTSYNEVADELVRTLRDYVNKPLMPLLVNIFDEYFWGGNNIF
jgi:hypothetical protein